MNEIYEARRKNLNELIARIGGRGSLTLVAKRLGYAWPGFVSQMRSSPGKYGHRVMTEKVAREIELQFSLPSMSMDVYPLPTNVHPAKEAQAQSKNKYLMALSVAADKAGIHLSGDTLTLALEAMKGARRDDSEYADLIVRLIDR